MTKDEAVKQPPTARTSHLGKRGAAEIPPFQRVIFGLLGVLAVAGGCLLMLRKDSPELGGTALIIVAALFLMLMVIGRLPKMLEIAGVPLEFERDEMAEFLRTLRAAVDTDTLSELESQLKSMSADSKLFKEAQRLADEQPEESDSVSAATQPSTHTRGEDTEWLSELKSQKGAATVEKEARVLGGRGSGRGQPPRVDHLVRINDQPVLVLEEVPAWNVSTLEVLGRRMNRVMSNHPQVEKLIVVFPDGGLRAAETWREEMWGDLAEHKVEVLAQSSDAAKAVQAWVSSLPAWHATPAA